MPSQSLLFRETIYLPGNDLPIQQQNRQKIRKAKKTCKVGTYTQYWVSYKKKESYNIPSHCTLQNSESLLVPSKMVFLQMSVNFVLLVNAAQIVDIIKVMSFSFDGITSFFQQTFNGATYETKYQHFEHWND